MESKTKGKGSALGKGRDFPLRRKGKGKRLVGDGAKFVIGSLGS